MPARGHPVQRPPSGARVTAGRTCTATALLCVCALAALAFIWSAQRILPAFHRAAHTPPNVSSELSPRATAHHAPGSSAQVLSPAFDPSVQAWAKKIMTWAEDFNLDPNLVATVMQLESCGNPHARSGAGALGLFQVMPYHFREGEDPLDPDVNAAHGLAYLASALDQASGSVASALAGYNGGHGQISRPENAWPEETRRYANWGTGIMQDLSSNATFSSTLETWRASGGDSLCREALETQHTQR